MVSLFNTFSNVQSPEVSCNEQSAFCASDISASGHGDLYNIELPEASSVGQELGFCKGSTDGNTQVIDLPEASYKQNGFVEDKVHFNYWSDRCKIHVRVQDRILLGFNADSFTQEGIYNEACYLRSTSNGKGIDLCKAAEGTSESSNIVFNSKIFGFWSHEESLKSSTWRELEAVRRVIRSNLVILKASHIQIFSDNQNVEHILQAGSKVQELQDLSLDINKICELNAISFSAKWIPKNENLLADHLSRCKDSDDWYISEDVFKTLDRKWGPHSIDRIATHYNRKCERFNSRWWVPGMEAVDCFDQTWTGELNWLVPPPSLITHCIRKMQIESAQGTLIIPEWPLASYWPYVTENGNFKYFITDWVILPASRSIIPGKGNNGVFAKSQLAFRILALKCIF